MKAKFVTAGMVCTAAEPCSHSTTVVDGQCIWNVGAIVDHPEAYKLVRMGVCVPGDEECRVAARMDAVSMSQAQHAYGRLEAGIQPEDYAAYDAGLMIGYDEDGNHIPGTNYREPEIKSGETTDGGVFIP